MITLATFELIPTDDLFAEIFYFPEQEPFSESFETCDLESNLFLSNIGFIDEVGVNDVSNYTLISLQTLLYVLSDQATGTVLVLFT